jgi:hypothetical protein
MLTAVVEAEGSGGSSRTHAAVHVPPPLILARCKQGDSLGGTYSRWRSVQTVVRHTSAGEESEERFEKHGIGVPPPPLFLLICVERDVRRHVNACEEAGLYVRICQHTSACVSIRQHASACEEAGLFVCVQTDLRMHATAATELRADLQQLQQRCSRPASAQTCECMQRETDA